MSAAHIVITREGGTASVVVDGVEIPAGAILRDSVSVPVDPSEIPSVTLTLTAGTVTVLNTLKEGT
ncbi:hypothetical protein [Streptomyces albipurpureus]|uniref:Uncharacterized protein n=1 Tax=Streptomyces albipurpureus TaxID=2897419 RepID=A0ABT0UNJ2_9ACTN|nr:hypothetical protein [Streptomyces sp. CWNU-1]MCM2390199.1 hypothetical protein [Streptomyces sp. CWNU-1]